MGKFKIFLLILLALWIAHFYLSPDTHTVHLKANPSNDGMVRVWKVTGSNSPVYTLVPESAHCVHTGSPDAEIPHVISIRYIHVKCGDVTGFIFNTNVQQDN
jgi:hypothetical protein